MRLATSRPVCIPILVASAAYGILSALRWPQAYAVSYMMIDYHFGFAKRGMAGAILERIDHPPYHFVTLAWMAFAVAAMWLGWLVLAAWRPIRSDTGVLCAVALFFLSAGFASLVCDVGRGEQFGLLLAIPCLLLPAASGWIAVRAGLLSLAILMQEANELIVVPVVAFDLWLALWSVRPGPKSLRILATILPAGLLTFYLGNAEMCRPEALAYFQRMAADFPFHPVPLKTLCVDGLTSLQLTADWLWSYAAQLARVSMTLIVTLPLVGFNLFLIGRVVRYDRLAMAASVGVAVSPMLLLIVAVDVERFVTLAQLTSLLALIAAFRRLGPPKGGSLPATPSRVTLVTALAMFQLGSAVTLNDGTQPLKFPFAPLIVRAIAVVQGQQKWVKIQ